MKLFYSDDDYDDILIFKAAVRLSLGNESALTVFRSGFELIDRLKASYTDLPDVILIDLHMPLMERNEVLNELKYNMMLKKILICILNSGPDTNPRTKRLQKGWDEYYHKPKEFEELKTMVRQIADRFGSRVGDGDPGRSNQKSIARNL